MPPRSWQSLFCKKIPTPKSCEALLYNPEIVNYSADYFEVKNSAIGEGAGRGTFAKVDIPKGSYLFLEEVATHLYFSSPMMKYIESIFEIANIADFRYLTSYM